MSPDPGLTSAAILALLVLSAFASAARLLASIMSLITSLGFGPFGRAFGSGTRCGSTMPTLPRGVRGGGGGVLATCVHPTTV